MGIVAFFVIYHYAISLITFTGLNEKRMKTNENACFICFKLTNEPQVSIRM